MSERITERDLRQIAAKLMNLDFDVLANAGVLTRKPDGSPSEGGLDWKRFNNDPLVFICKLSADRRTALAELVQP